MRAAIAASLHHPDVPAVPDHRQLLVHGADERHQMQTLARSVIVRQIVRDHRYPERAEDRLQLRDAGPVGAVSASHRQSAIVDPERVSAFNRARCLDLAQDRDPDLGIGTRVERDLVHSLRFPRPQQDRAAA